MENESKKKGENKQSFFAKASLKADGYDHKSKSVGNVSADAEINVPEEAKVKKIEACQLL